MNRKAIIIATPDSAQRSRLDQIVNKMPQFRVIARTADLMNTYNTVEEQSPSAVLIADVLAELPEFEVMRALFATFDVRWLILTSQNRNSHSGLIPIRVGARGSDIFSIPDDSSEWLIEQQLSALTRTKRHQQPPAAVRHVLNAPAPTQNAHRSGPKPANRAPSSARQEEAYDPRPPARAKPTPLATASRPGSPIASTQQEPPQHLVGSMRSPSHNITRDRLIVIGASTGGVEALLGILTRFPANCPPTLIVQHTGTGFGESLVSLLDRQILPKARLATHPQPLQRGKVLVAAGTRSHLVLAGAGGTRADIVADGPVSGHIPSVDMLFESSIPHASRVSAALLTGMGRDGAAGMKALHDAGAFTIAQDEASCVVYGMPRAAVESGCVDRVLHIDQIADALLSGSGTAATTEKELYR